MSEWFETEIITAPSGDDRSSTGSNLSALLCSRVEEIAASPFEVSRRGQIAADLSLYAGRSIAAAELFIGNMGAALEQGTAFNLTYSIVNTIRNRICSFRARGQFMPNGGDRQAESGARDKTAMCDAWMREQNYWDQQSLMMRDSLTGDGGIIKLYREGNGADERVSMGRFPGWEFLVDQGDAIYGEPECIYHIRLMSVGRAARYYKVPQVTLAASTAKMGVYGGPTTSQDFVQVIEAYARGENGRHSIVVGDTVVVDEEWKHDGFPIIKQIFDECETGYGYWGSSAIRALRPIQEELTEWETAMRESHRLTSQQVWILPNGSEAPTNVTNDYVRIAKAAADGQKPDVINPAAVNAEMYRYGEILEQGGYKILGVSQFLASGVKQPGVTSRVAIRETSELQSDRLALLSQRNERTAVDTTNWWWKLTRDMCRQNKEVKPTWRAIDRGAWKEMVFGDLDAEYMIDVFPTSIFGQGVSGQLDKADDLIQRGWLSREDAMRALSVPDLSPIMDMALSESDAMEFIVDKILEDGVYTTPDPFLASNEKLNPYAAARYRRAITKGADYPKQNLALLRRLIRATAPKNPAAPPVLGGATPPPPAPTLPPMPGIPGVGGMPIPPVGAVPPPGAMPVPQPVTQ